MAVATSTAILIGAGVSALGVGYQGLQQRDAQKSARRRLQEQQREALAAASAETRAATERERAANRRQPDISDILLGEEEAARSGLGASTMLTGPRGIDLERMRLRLQPDRLLGA